MSAGSPSWEVEVFYDGACPLCRREIAMLERLDKRQRIRFTDITSATFEPAALGLDMASLMARIQGRTADGTMLQGVEVFRRLYAAVGFGWLVALTRLPLIAPLLDVFYNVFAKHRLRLTGRCDASCDVRVAPQRADLH